MVERRRYMRFDVLLDAICKKGGEDRKLKVKNFSREGVGIVSEENIVPGENVEIEMMIPGDNMPVMVSGEVAWIDSDNIDAFGYNGGLKFKKVENSARSKILDHIYSKWLMPKKAKQ